MADILIRGMEMPKYTTKAEFGIDADGNPLCMVYHEDGTEPDIYDVIPIPKGHGRLGDLDALAKQCDSPHWCVWLNEIQDAPTIVPAEGGNANGNP